MKEEITLNSLIKKYEDKIKETQQWMYDNKVPLGDVIFDDFDEKTDISKYTCYPIELWEEILQDLTALKEKIIEESDTVLAKEYNDEYLKEVVNIDAIIGKEE